MQHVTRKTSHVERVLGLVVLSGVLALTTLTAGAEPDLEDARAERDAARAAAAAAVEELELLEAEDAQVADAIEESLLAVDNQLARVEAARAFVETTEAEAKRLRRLVDETTAEVELARDEARLAAVEAFIGVGVDDAEYWLTEQDPTEAARMVELLRVVSGNSADTIDALRNLELTQTVLIEAADEAEREASNARDALEAELVERQRRVESQQAVKGELQTRIVSWEAEVAEFEETEATLTARIQELQTLALGTTDHTPGAASLRGFIKPVSGEIGSGFGWRVHPIYGTSRMHNGLDMSGDTGDPIWASKDGVVLEAGWNGGYGNAVVIDHGDGVTTLYGHQSELFVSAGDSVRSGDTIGTVGSTGLSTGPHLHFEVRINGLPNDPLLFLP